MFDGGSIAVSSTGSCSVVVLAAVVLSVVVVVVVVVVIVVVVVLLLKYLSLLIEIGLQKYFFSQCTFF